MSRLFGTDGVRGVAITGLTCELSLNIGKALVTLLDGDSENKRPTILIGKDTRRSSDILEAALIAGITSVGGDVQTLGVVPTPAVAYLVKEYNANAGVMITASHNSAEFNGIKIFNKDGFKFPDEVEDELERYVNDVKSIEVKSGGDVGTVTQLSDNAASDYMTMLEGLSECSLDGIKVLVDCANGSACSAVEVLVQLGCDCMVIHDNPDGMNINDKCGSTYIDRLGKQVVTGGFDLGIAFDGDADRMLAVDEQGNIVDGDKIIALLSVHMKEQGKLKHDTAVVTVMSNLGFHQYMEQNEIKTAVVGVGDRYVLERMVQDDCSIGGEQSGHIIFKEYATTGDGMITAIKLMNMLVAKGESLSSLVSEIPSFPQTLKNVTISEDKKGTWESNVALTDVIEKVSALAGEKSRILIRESGTEPLLRVMFEGECQQQIEQWADEICEVAKRELS